MIRKITTMAALLIACCVTTLSAQVSFNTGDIQDLYKSAGSQDKLLFVDVYATWCPPCKAMESQVFSREDVGKYMAENFVAAKYDIDKGIGKELARAHNISSIPTYLVFDGDGKLVARMVGYMEAQDFIQKMSDIRKR